MKGGVAVSVRQREKLKKSSRTVSGQRTEFAKCGLNILNVGDEFLLSAGVVNVRVFVTGFVLFIYCSRIYRALNTNVAYCEKGEATVVVGTVPR